MLCKFIYGIDESKPLTTVMVRDAIIECFAEVHKDILETSEHFVTLKKMTKSDRIVWVKEFIKSIFRWFGGDFDNPTKQDLIKVVHELQDYAKEFKNPKTISKHAKEIMGLIKKIK
jgi:hypothetical protein